MEPNDIYYLEDDNKKLWMFGDVAIVQYGEEKRRRIQGKDGKYYEALEWAPDGEAFLDFVTIRSDGDEIWEDEDSPVQGGFDEEYAKALAEDLKAAAKFYTKNFS